MRRVFSSESVTEGHPDKVADLIADRVLDSCLEKDPYSRVAAEVALFCQHAVLFGEVTTSAAVDYEKVVRDTVRSLGYDRPELGFSADGMEVEIAIHEQSPDIALGLRNADLEGGAGDQGIMFGYAEKDGIEFLPLPIALAHRLCRKLAEVRKNGRIPYLRPDGKSQVSVEYDESGKAMRIASVVLSSAHDDDVELGQLREDILRKVILETIQGNLIDDETRFLINPTGRFVLSGPAADSGLTGRKLIVDTYGGASRHGGGAFSGKDASKTDRTASYAARFLAKNIVASGMADRAEVELAYAIGVAEPVSVLIETFGTEKVALEEIYRKVRKVDLRPNALIERFDLRRPIFGSLTNYGHFGENAASRPWEQLDESLF